MSLGNALILILLNLESPSNQRLLEIYSKATPMVSYAHSWGGVLIGFTTLFILGVVLSFAWIGLTESTHSDGKGTERDSSIPSRTNGLIYALIGGLLGARLIFTALHLPYYNKNPNEIIALWQGGLSATGGMIGAILGVITLTWRSRRHLWIILDDIAIPALILTMTAWIGSWLDGVAYGRQVPFEWTWLMNSDPFRGQIARWPTQMVGLLLSLIAFLFLFRVSSQLPQGMISALSGALIALILTIVGVFRADPSMLLMGQRLDVLAPALLTIIGFGVASYRWHKATNLR
jgi:phosphatidylglycerol:prolipoprotein diacylglycerol transferase